MTVNQNVAVLKYMNFSIQTTRSNHHWNGRYADIPISHTKHLDTKLHVHKYIITITYIGLFSFFSSNVYKITYTYPDSLVILFLVVP